MPPKQKIVVLRFSAMGDVAMVASVLREFANQHPNVELIMVSRDLFRPFFAEIPYVSFHSIEPKSKHKGFFGLYRLFKELNSLHPNAIADLHENLRSRIICSFFKVSGLKVERLDKGRAEKTALTRTTNKIFKQLRPMVERYADVFRNLGFELNLSHKLKRDEKELPKDLATLFKDHSSKKIGISPFAQHDYKMYPLDQLEEVIAKLNELHYEIFIFGGGSEEELVARNWTAKFKNVHNLIAKYNLSEELAIISNLDMMLSMDSVGMHMASLMGVRTISIWGPTHPYAGFLGYGQSDSDCLQIDDPIRPTSVYGNKPCICGVKTCISLIEPNTILEKINSIS